MVGILWYVWSSEYRMFQNSLFPNHPQKRRTLIEHRLTANGVQKKGMESWVKLKKLHFFSFIDPLHIKLMLPSGFNLTALNGAVLYVHK